MHIIAAKAVAFREAATDEFKSYQQQLVKNAAALAQHLGEEGFRIVSGGTDNHLVLVDVSTAGLTGRDAEQSLEAAGITVNKNNIPFDTKPPLVASGIRMGTPAVTSRGMKEPEMAVIAQLMTQVMKQPDDTGVRSEVRSQVSSLCERFPLYDSLW